MTKTENGNKYARIAAICCAACAIFNIVNRIIYISNSEYSSITVLNILFWIGMIGMATALFVKSKEALISAVGIRALLEVYYIISYFDLFELCNFLAYTTVIVLGVLSLKENNAVQKFWLFPAAILLLGNVAGWVTWGYFEALSATWKFILIYMVEIAALLFTGMWLKEAATSAAEKRGSVSNVTCVGNAEKLKKLKSLLDCGAITEEEFQAQKAKLLE